jgi:tRNA (mo5U34)-methyltransferase
MKRQLYKDLPIQWDMLEPILQERACWPMRDNEKKYLQALEAAPKFITTHGHFADSFVTIGKRRELNDEDYQQLVKSAKGLIPWKKGPFKLFDLEIDGEWRSDFKWDRLQSHLPDLKGKRILDVGCNNGYFMFRMLEHSPHFVLGIDPVVRTWAQFQFVNRYLPENQLDMALLGVEHVKYFPQTFDIIFSMGIIYHHPDPIDQLRMLKQALRPGGSLILETIGIPGEESVALFPEDRYAKMRNIWFIPTLSCLKNWAIKAKFKSVDICHSVPLTCEEQRTTPWCNENAPSLEDFLDPDDKTKTVEGHPAPYRMTVIARV